MMAKPKTMPEDLDGRTPYRFSLQTKERRRQTWQTCEAGSVGKINVVQSNDGQEVEKFYLTFTHRASHPPSTQTRKHPRAVYATPAC